MLKYLQAIWKNNPVRVAAVLASIAVAGAKAAGLILDEANVAELIGLIVPLLLGGEIARQKVTPYPGEIGTPNDDALIGAAPPAPPA